MINFNCYDNSDFTFEDEVKWCRKKYGKSKKTYCDVFRLKLYDEIKRLEWLKYKIVENLILINEKQPDDWKKYVLKDMEYQRILIEERNKWNKIIEKHKDNMINNGIECDEISREVVRDYHKLMTRS